jgi:predicted regulator of Ras-like GTPase activity (Roadblock/LC7/MglB family)
VSATAFSDALRRVARRIPEAEVLMVIGTDGIPIEKLHLREQAENEAVAAELTGLLRATVSTSEETGLGPLRELSVGTDRRSALLVSITPDYFLYASLAPGAILGRARFALRLAGASLLSEFL